LEGVELNSISSQEQTTEQWIELKNSKIVKIRQLHTKLKESNRIRSGCTHKLYSHMAINQTVMCKYGTTIWGV